MSCKGYLPQKNKIEHKNSLHFFLIQVNNEFQFEEKNF